MGVPAFFRWLSKKYPSIVVHAVESKKKDINGVTVPVDNTAPNPNDIEFDNLYLDMNGIIHPCCHPENKPAPKNEEEMMVAIFEYIDRLFSICRPRKLLYMAIDGVAPRAKMNQQRSRRFRASKESSDKAEDIAKIRQRLEEDGALLPPVEKKDHFDSNCITPGTEFMFRLSKCLKYYIADRMRTDPAWQQIKVILSDANVPGEGEHKIMDYIRHQRSQPDHDPNTRHCLNGADADLIMLGLATHELNFTIIREEFKPGQKKLPCEICGQHGHERDECQGLPREKQGEFDELAQPFEAEQEFIFIRLNVLREYLERELKLDGLPFPYSFERCLDDWVFMCFFVGNDFLPHLPSLEIREGAIDRLVRIYKGALPRLGGYLAKDGLVNLGRVQRIMHELGTMEDEIFKRRQENELSFRRRQKQRKMNEQHQARMNLDERQLTPLMRSGNSPRGGRGQGWSPRGGHMNRGWSSAEGKNWSSNQSHNQQAASDLRKMLLTPDEAKASPGSTPGGSPFSSFKSSPGGSPASSQGGSPATGGMKRKREEEKDEEEGPPDEIRLWEDGWRERYYDCKFGVNEDNGVEEYNEFRKGLAHAYVRGLCWVLQYYYQGCPSWKWYYPHHYAPFASDFVGIHEVESAFDKGTEPVKPLEQLMGVFPAASGKFLPPSFRDLMSSPESPIIDFYPIDFKIDLNGKKYAWQGVALLPFVDEKRLLDTLADVYPDLTESEVERNGRDKNTLFVGCRTKLYDFIKGLYEGDCLKTPQDIPPDLTFGMAGTILADKCVVLPTRTMFSPIPSLPSLENINSISVKFCDPEYADDFVFPAKVLDKAEAPKRVLKPQDFPQNQRYMPQTGFSPNSHNPYHVSGGGQRMVRSGLGYHDGILGQAPNSAPGLLGSYQGRSQSYNDGGTPRGRRSDYSSTNRGGAYGTSLLGRYPTTPPYSPRDSGYEGRHYDRQRGQTFNHGDRFGNNRGGYYGDRRDYQQAGAPQGSRNEDPRRRSYPLTQRYQPY